MKKLTKNKYFICFVFGAISAFAFAPTHLFILAIIAFSGLFLNLDKCQNNKDSFLIGWFFGFGHFIFGLYWFGIALLTDFPRFIWIIPAALTVIPGILACYIGLTTLATNVLAKITKSNKFHKLLIMSISWILFEWFRLYFFSGFPWNLIGYSFGFSLNILQIASIVGVYGLSLLAIVSYTVPALFFEFENKKLKFQINKESLFVLFSIVVILISTWTYGNYRIKNAKIELVENGNLRLVQSSIRQDEKRNPRTRFNAFRRNIQLTKSAGFENINYVIWSESAIPYIISEENHQLLQALTEAVPKNGFLIGGAVRAKYQEKYPNMIEEIWNSAFVINDNQEIVEIYDKNHLVPFGEYIPFQELFPFISKITEGEINFSAGTQMKTIRPKKNFPSFSPLICYEVIFPDKIMDENNPPEFLINITNDAWFGKSMEPYQHLDMARMRTIEYGMPLARVANTGISALIDPYGRIVKKIDLNKEDFIDVKLMKNLPETIYSKYGTNLLLLIIYIILLLIAKRSYDTFKK